ncbi:acetylcholine receptor subunit alpha-like 1 [Sipha flava]|uniref:Acetylcholine receptor subunit alpha-like 1 n=2 Tax=Sipha flava TaxID=143950 RepID=A0A8B8FME0_9HEMI|nr:acetylcholine receptor subunit alpha-like 1 [Sipha flava]
MDVLRLQSFLITLTAYFFAVDAGFVQTPKENITAAHALRKHLFKNYDRVVVPATSKKLVQIKMITIFNSVELSYDTSQMTFHTWMNVEWNDDRLTWNPDDYDQIGNIMVEPHEIWYPDFRAYNNLGVDVERGNTHAMINSTGHVLWVPPIRYRVHCKMDMARWPYDVHTGYLKVGSWVYNSKVINMTGTAPLHEIMAVSPYPEWQILRISSEKFTRIYPCCPDDPYEHVEYNVTIGREIREHGTATFALIILPVLSTALLNLLVFCIPPDDKSKLITSLFNGLIVVSILLVIYSKIPLILSSVPFIVLYYAYSLGLTVLAAVISVALNNLTTTPKPLPKPINVFVQSRFVEMLQMEIKGSTHDDQTDSKTVEFNRRRIFANVIDKICFALFSCIYIFLIFRFIF